MKGLFFVGGKYLSVLRKKDATFRIPFVFFYRTGKTKCLERWTVLRNVDEILLHCSIFRSCCWFISCFFSFDPGCCSSSLRYRTNTKPRYPYTRYWCDFGTAGQAVESHCQAKLVVFYCTCGPKSSSSRSSNPFRTHTSAIFLPTNRTASEFCIAADVLRAEKRFHQDLRSLLWASASLYCVQYISWVCLQLRCADTRYNDAEAARKMKMSIIM